MTTISSSAPPVFRIRVSRAFKALDDGVRRKWLLVVPARDLPPNLPLDANARVPNVLKNPTCREMRETLLKTPDLFQVFNGGMICTANTVEVKQEGNDHVAYVSFNHDEEQGVVNGGHTYACLIHVLQDNMRYAEDKSLKTVLAQDARNGITGLDDLIADDTKLAERLATARERAQVQIEIVAPVATAELLVAIARARNLSQSVEATALANLAGKFEMMKQVLRDAADPFGPSFVNRVVWKTNQEVPDDGPQISVKLLIQVLALMNIRAYPPNSRVAAGVYQRSGVVVREFGEAEGATEEFYKALTTWLPQFVRLYDLIYETLPQVDPSYPWADGRFGTERLPKPKLKATPFLGHICESKVANAFVWPIFSAFRALLEETSAGAVRFVEDPFALFEEKKNELVSAVQDFHRNQANGMIQMVGKDKEIWVRLESKILNELDIRRRLGTPPRPLLPWPSCPVPDTGGNSSCSGQTTGQGVGASELSFANEPEFKFARNATVRFLFVLGWAYRKHSGQFDLVRDKIRGAQRIYFARSADEIERSGISTSPKQIPGTPYWVCTNLPNAMKNEILAGVLHKVLGYDRDAVRCALGC
ncbi:MAG: AIPR family protein [Planctomycetota bacterium]|nr:AIPR family protein [Planctomycetota bacterium]